MKHLKRLVACAAAAAVTAAGLVAATPAQAAPNDAEALAQAEHESIINFWTSDKLASAMTRDYVADPETGAFALNPGRQPQPAETPETTATVPGRDWTGRGAVQAGTGKVFFVLNNRYWVCSAAVARDSNGKTSTILTAAHCVYDVASRTFARNWMFIPDYDTKPANLGGSSFCAATKYGCWTARALTVHRKYATAGSFNTKAAMSDFAFATVGAGGKRKTQLDRTVPTQAIKFSPGKSHADTYAFGYPAVSPWNGKRLIYSRDAMGYDPLTKNQTYRITSTMTGGASGGPWFQNFSRGRGTMMSVNSYGYKNSNFMHGPKLNADTRYLYGRSQGATKNSVVG